MLRKLGLGGLFGQKIDHPLADPKDLRRVIAELPTDNAFKTLDEIIDWFSYLAENHHLPAERYFEALVQFETVAQPHILRFSREYLQNSRLSRAEERRLWAQLQSFWAMLATNYERCLQLFAKAEKLSDAQLQLQPVLCIRVIRALGTVLKWERFQYGVGSGSRWGGLGQVVLYAKRQKFVDQPTMFPGLGKPTTVHQEFKRVMIFQSASLDALRPAEMELAEILLGYFLAFFDFSEKARHDSIYWVDLAVPQAPQRLAKVPARAELSQRFFKAGDAFAAMGELLSQLERGDPLPEGIKLNGLQFTTAEIIANLRHLVAYLSPEPPLRRFERHRVSHRMAVVEGFANIHRALLGGVEPEKAINWHVENVSRGGFGAVFKPGAEVPRIGDILAMQPEGGENWLLGAIRRCRRDDEGNLHVGIEVLTRKVLSVGLRSSATPSYAIVAKTPGVLLDDGNFPGEVRMMLPPASYSARDSLDATVNGQKQLLTPIALLAQGGDYVLARFRISEPAA